MTRYQNKITELETSKFFYKHILLLLNDLRSLDRVGFSLSLSANNFFTENRSSIVMRGTFIETVICKIK